jgi:hypothetical protein
VATQIYRRTNKEQFVHRYTDLFYDPKDPSNLKVFKERQLFLRIAAQIVPDFAQSFFEATWRTTADWIQPNGSLPPPRSAAYTEYWSQLFGAIGNWARRFNIETGWVIDEVWCTAFTGIAYEEKGIGAVLAFGTWRRSPQPTHDTRAFQLPAWDPRVETKPSYIARADGAWEQLRDAYVEQTENDLLRLGLKRIPAKRKNRVTAEVRFEWAALLQCTDTPIDDLAERYNAETETIRVSTDRILKGLGFPPRT